MGRNITIALCLYCLIASIFADTIFTIGSTWYDETKDLALDTSTGQFYVVMHSGGASTFSTPILLRFDSSCNLEKYQVMARNYHIIPEKLLLFRWDYIVLAAIKYFPTTGYELALYSLDSSLNVKDSAFRNLNGIPLKVLITHYKSSIVVIASLESAMDTIAYWIVFDTLNLNFTYELSFPPSFPKYPTAVFKETDTTYLLGFSGDNLSIARVYKENTIIASNTIVMNAKYFISSLYRDANYGVLVGGRSSYLSDTLGGFLALINDNLSSISAIEYWAYQPKGSAINDVFIYNGQAYTFGYTTMYGYTPSQDAYLVSYFLPAITWNPNYSTTYGTDMNDYIIRAIPFRDSVIILGTTWGKPSNDIPDALIAKLPLSALNPPLIYNPKNHYTLPVTPLAVEDVPENPQSPTKIMTLSLDGKILPIHPNKFQYAIRKHNWGNKISIIISNF